MCTLIHAVDSEERQGAARTLTARVTSWGCPKRHSHITDRPRTRKSVVTFSLISYLLGFVLELFHRRYQSLANPYIKSFTATPSFVSSSSYNWLNVKPPYPRKSCACPHQPRCHHALYRCTYGMCRLKVCSL